MEAFEFLNLDEPKKKIEEGMEPEDPTMRTPKFYDHLIYNGYKYTDEMADVVVKEADPKNKGEFIYEKFVDNTIKTVKKKKKKRGGMKK